MRGPQSGHVLLRRADAPPGVELQFERPEAEVSACSIVSESESALAACSDIVRLGSTVERLVCAFCANSMVDAA